VTYVAATVQCLHAASGNSCRSPGTRGALRAAYCCSARS